MSLSPFALSLVPLWPHRLSQLSTVRSQARARASSTFSSAPTQACYRSSASQILLSWTPTSLAFPTTPAPLLGNWSPTPRSPNLPSQVQTRSASASSSTTVQPATSLRRRSIRFSDKAEAHSPGTTLFLVWINSRSATRLPSAKHVATAPVSAVQRAWRMAVGSIPRRSQAPPAAAPALAVGSRRPWLVWLAPWSHWRWFWVLSCWSCSSAGSNWSTRRGWRMLELEMGRR